MKIAASHKYLEILYNLYADGIDTRNKTERYLKHHGYSHIGNKVETISAGRPKKINLGGNIIYKIGEWKPTREITTADWKPASLIEHAAPFYDWINSINLGFDKIIEYDKLNLYCEQVNNWLADQTSINDYNSKDDKIAYLIGQRRKMRDNSLYYLEKNHYIKDASQIGGKLKYHSDRAQRIIAFLIDSGYSSFFAKPRQMWATTTFFGIFESKAMYNKSLQIYIISANEKKAEDTLRDKIKANVYMHNQNVRPTITSDAAKYIGFYEGVEYGGVGSRIAVGATTNTSVNSASPDIVGVDETGLIMNLGEIISEIRPTLKGFNPATGKQELMRQLVMWGTAGNVDGGGGAFRMEFDALNKLWEERNFSTNIVPVFFNYMARPGMTEADYEREYKVAYSYEGEGKEEKRRIFHQSYPKTKDDLFMTSSDTMISRDEISGHIIRIRESISSGKITPVWGYFNPNFDVNKINPNKNDDVKYQIAGKPTFVPVLDPSERGAIWCKFKEPEVGWTKRYYQGTDPIKGASGRSKFASAIGDNLEIFDDTDKKVKGKEIVAVMNYRTTDYRTTFLQCLLGGLYYDLDIQNLVESNDGSSYIDYVMDKGFGNTIMNNAELPMHYHLNSTTPFGLNKRGQHIPQMILNDLEKSLLFYAKGIPDVRFWLQLMTFTRNTTPTGYVKYKPKDIRFNFDDIIDAVTYTFVNMYAHADVKPENINDLKNKNKGKFKTICNENTGWSPMVVPADADTRMNALMGFYPNNPQLNLVTK